MIQTRLKGMGVALITPFNEDGSVDYEALLRLVDYQLQNGTDFLCVLGTTAETPTLTKEEKEKVKRTVIDRVNGRIPILLGVGSNSTQAVVESVKNDDMTGVDALLVVVPYYNKPSQAGMIEHFSAVAEAVDLPVILYNIPSRTGVNMSVDTVKTLARKYENIVGIKQSYGDMDAVTELRASCPSDFVIYSTPNTDNPLSNKRLLISDTLSSGAYTYMLFPATSTLKWNSLITTFPAKLG
jgi:4-hydroxy-tetrahydrodipicolinate synthase